MNSNSKTGDFILKITEPITDKVEKVLYGPEWIEDLVYINLAINLFLVFATVYIGFLVFTWINNINKTMLKVTGFMDKEPDLFHSIYLISEIEPDNNLNILEDSKIKLIKEDVLRPSGTMKRKLIKSFKVPLKGFYLVSYRYTVPKNSSQPISYFEHNESVSLENEVGVSSVNGNKISHQTGMILITDIEKPLNFVMSEENQLGGYLRIIYLGKITKKAEKYRRHLSIF